MKKVSVIIPVYNAECYLKECVESVLSQRVDLELILVDDCSTDQTAAICLEYAAKDSRVKLLRNSINTCAGFCRNRGIDVACGKYLFFVDADDRVEPDALEKFVAIAEKHNLEILRGKARAFDHKTGEFIQGLYYEQKNVKSVLAKKICNYEDHYAEIAALSVVPWIGIIRTDFVQRYNCRFQNLKCSNDISFFFETVIRARRLQYLPVSIMQHRVNNCESLMGIRSTNYRCVIESTNAVIAAIRCMPQRMKKSVMDKVLNSFGKWLKNALSASDDKQAVIDDFAAFFRKLDLSPWGDGWCNAKWYAALDGVIPDNAFVREKSPSRTLVSVILPIYNMAKYIRPCLNSLVAQNISELEIICVDDGSTDETISILNEYVAAHNNIRLYTQVNSGAGAARNLGLSHARGEFVYFCDPDDYVDSSALKKMRDLMISESADVCLCRFYRFDNATARLVSESSFGPLCQQLIAAGRRSAFPDHLSNELFSTGGYVPWNKLFRRSFIESHKIRFQELRRTNDMFFVTIALANARRIAFVDEPLYYNRRGCESTVTKDSLCGSFAEALTVVKDRLLKDGLYDTYKYAFARIAVNSVVFNIGGCRDLQVLKSLYSDVRSKLLLLFDESVISCLDEGRARICYAMRADASVSGVLEAIKCQKQKRGDFVKGVYSKIREFPRLMRRCMKSLKIRSHLHG